MIFLTLFATFFKIGLFTFGGGYAMIPLIQSEVLGHGWLSLSQIIDFIAVSESTPGPFAINMATFVGTNQGGVLGGICATLGVVMPSFIIILMVARFYEKFKTNKIVKGAMSGLKPAVVGLIGAAVLSIGKSVFFPQGLLLSVFETKEFYVSVTTALLMLFFAFKKVHPIIIVCLSAVIGILSGYFIL